MSKKSTSFSIIIVLALVAVVAGLVLTKVFQVKKLIEGSKAALPPESVSTAVATHETWQPTLTAVGSLSAVQGVTVAAELDGKIVEVDFESGTPVKKGDVLVRQDTSVEEAQLRSAEAAVDLAHITLERTRELLAKQTVSQSQFDTDAAAEKQAIAAADNIRATIAKKTIKAPFSGRLGIRLVNVGQSLKAGDGLVSLQALDPIYADFYLPQQDLSQIAISLPIRVSSDAFPDKPVEGKITAISPDVDSTTRNVRIQATLENPGERLHPGMFVDVAVVLPNTTKVLSIPTTAVLPAPYGDSVYIVDKSKVEGESDKLVVRQQIVRLGVHKGDYVSVLSGLSEGDVVVTSGVFRLRPGLYVVVNNAVAPDAKVAPKPNDS